MQRTRLKFVHWLAYESTTLPPGHFQIKLKITIDGKPKYKESGVWVKANQWDATGQKVVDHPQARDYNIRLKKLYKDHDTTITKAIVNDTGITHATFKKAKVTVKQLIYGCMTEKNADFEWYKVKEYAGEGVAVQSFGDREFIKGFEAWQLEQKYFPSSIFMSMQRIKAVCKVAKSMGLIYTNPYDKVVEAEYYKPPKKEDIEKSFLTEPERDRFFEYFQQLKGMDVRREAKQGLRNGQRFHGAEYFTLVYFLLSCFTALRKSDLYAFDVHSRVQSDGYIRLRTKKNKEWVVQKIGPRLREILNEIKRIGPLDVICYGTFCIHLDKLSKKLQIPPHKKVTPHTGRHTYGYMCAKRKVPKETAMELMGITSDIIDVYYHLAGETVKEHGAVMAE